MGCVAPLLALVLFAAGCSGVAEVTGTATQSDLRDIRNDIMALQVAVQRLRSENQGLAAQVEGRVKEQTGEADRQRVDMVRRVDALSKTVAALGSRVDELSARVDNGAARPRSATPGAGQPKPPVTPAPVTPSRPPATNGGAPTTPSTPRHSASLGPQDVYQAAYIDYSKGSYQLAIAGFREFLRRYPDNALAGNAQYWIGEADLGLAREYANAGHTDRATQALEQAVQEFRKVVANYPRGDKAPTALYKEGLALIDLKQPAAAQSRLQYLVDTFPQAPETPLAKEQLLNLKAR